MEALRRRARAAELAGLVVFSPVNLRYLSGFHSNAYSRPLALVVPADGDPTLLVPRLEEHQAHDLSWVSDIGSFVEWAEGSRAGGSIEAEFQALLREVLGERHLLKKRLGFERAALSAIREPALKAAIPDVEWTDVSGWVEAIRVMKSAEETENHRLAAKIAGVGLDAGFALARDGRSEFEIKGAAIAAASDEAARAYPDRFVSVAGNALVGSRIAGIHAPASGARARPTDLVFLVLSVSFEGSACELSRTVVAGPSATPEQQRLFRAVRRAHEAARAAARPGTPGQEIDVAARRALAEFGLAAYLPMRAGHGLGFGGVEAPNLGAGDGTPLAAGMIISIEPGVCIPGVGGVLWADNYQVTDEGLSQLTNYPIESHGLDG